MSALTRQSILDSIGDMPLLGGRELFPFQPFQPLGFGGLNIDTIPARPKIQLGAAAPVSDQCRAEFNAWLWRMFGDAKPVVPLGSAYMFGGRIVMNERDFNVLKVSCL